MCRPPARGQSKTHDSQILSYSGPDPPPLQCTATDVLSRRPLPYHLPSAPVLCSRLLFDFHTRPRISRAQLTRSTPAPHTFTITRRDARLVQPRSGRHRWRQESDGPRVPRPVPPLPVAPLPVVPNHFPRAPFTRLPAGASAAGASAAAPSLFLPAEAAAGPFFFLPAGAAAAPFLFLPAGAAAAVSDGTSGAARFLPAVPAASPFLFLPAGAAAAVSDGTALRQAHAKQV